MSTKKINRQQLLRTTLSHQGLHKVRPFGKGKTAVLAAIQQLGYVQIDTLSVVERAHHHIFWSRIPDYKKEHLDLLVQERQIFEYWFHAASYLPMKDYRFALPRMTRFRNNEAAYLNNVDSKILAHVHDKIRIDGPQKARDFQTASRKPGSWWNWKPAKIALEKLFMQGDIMVSQRDGMQKIYDLAERVLPSTIDTTPPSALEWATYLVQTHLQAYGVTSLKQIIHLKKGKTLRKDIQIVLQSMLEEGIVEQIDTIDKSPIFVQVSSLGQFNKKLPPTIRLLSPFDNAIIHRDRMELLSAFHYRLECYTPQAKRQYGYFCLPILWGDTFLGRVDCKAHRKTGQLELIHLHIEQQTENAELWMQPLVKAIQKFASFNGCSSIVLSRVSPQKFFVQFSRLL